jgi:hypothetical protein
MSQDLKVVLSLVDDFTKHLTGIETELGTFGRKIDGTIQNVMRLGSAFTAVFAVNQIKSFIEQGINYGETVDKMSKITGLSVEETQRLDFVMKESGSSIEAMQRPLRMLSVEAYNGNKAFSALGISTKDNSGNLKDAGVLFEETIIKLSGIENTSERAALAQKLFGKGAADVLAVVGQGKDRIKEFLDQTDKFNLVLGDKAVTALKKVKEEQILWNQQLTVLEARLTSLAGPLVEKWLSGAAAITAWVEKQIGIVPVIDTTTQKIKDLKENISEYERVLTGHKKGDYIQDSIMGVPVIGDYNGLMAHLQNLKKELKDLEPKSNLTVTNPDDFKEKKGLSFNEWRAKETEQNLTKMYKHWQKLSHDNNEALYKDDLEHWKKETEDFNTYAAQRAQSFSDELKKAHEIANQYVSIGAEIGYAIANGLTSGKDQFKNILKGILDIGLDFVEKLLIETITTNTFKNIIAAPPGVGWIVGATKGAAEAALITASFEVAKAGVKAFGSGTRNAPGGWADLGEYGKERAYIPAGTHVYNNQETRQMDNRQLTINFHDHSGGLVDTLYAEIRKGGSSDRLLSLLNKKLATV